MPGMSPSPEIVIQTQDLTKTYKGVEALKNLNLTVHKNSIFGFLGPNGAGKTTTIKLLLGLIFPTSGNASVFGLDIRQQSVDIRTHIGYLPQDPRFYEHLTARETLDYTARFFFKGPDQALRERVEETLELVGLKDKADRPIKGFSGGERQRLGIAQAQVNYPDLLILDEPAASLDPLGRRDVLEVMERLRKYATVFYSTHILDDVQRVSDTVAILNNGELITLGPIESLLAGGEGVVYQVGLIDAPPQARQALESLPWVKSVQDAPLRREHPLQEGEISWLVAVSDAKTAEAQLLRELLVFPELSVTEFRRREYNLEDVFVQIVEGDKHGGQ
jgi:ABC-2 type transport system ATP-binding protein